MKREIVTTEDGSKTIFFPDWDEHYHSIHGAIQESYHVFITKGLFHVQYTHPNTKTLDVLEIGFGTGLNAFITFIEAQKNQLHINYTGIEAYPIKDKEVNQLNYVTQLKAETYSTVFKTLHSCKWESPIEISNTFQLTKRKQFFKNISEKEIYNLIYFDAFGARVQPELWTEAIFKLMYNALKPKGVLTTYAAKGSVRRAMQSVGFTVERLDGPPGKREMLRATK